MVLASFGWEFVESYDFCATRIPADVNDFAVVDRNEVNYVAGLGIGVSCGSGKAACLERARAVTEARVNPVGGVTSRSSSVLGHGPKSVPSADRPTWQSSEPPLIFFGTTLSSLSSITSENRRKICSRSSGRTTVRTGSEKYVPTQRTT